MKRCSKCNNLMPNDALRCIRCGFQLAPTNQHEINDSSVKGHASTGNAANTRRIGWLKIVAAVLASNFFFLTSCTGGFIASYISLLKLGGDYMDQGATPSESMVVIAAVPDPAKQSAVPLKQVALRDLEKFQAVNPTHSFLLPLGSGRIPIHSEAYVTYEVQPAGDGKVLVETKYRQSMGGLVMARYEAVDKSVQPIFTNNVQWFVAFVFGFLVAIALYIVGRILRFWAR